MDTATFLSKILPNDGLVVLAEIRNGIVKHHFYPSPEKAAEAVATLDSRGGDVYHACASFKTNESRKQSNVFLVKSFWLDIDVGKADGYQTRNEAKDHLVEFCQAVGFHHPTIVSSGKGLHCYWVFEEAVSGDVWKAGATLFRQALDAVGFKHDPSRTTDQASILRPVGSTWRKAEGRPVKALLDSVVQPFNWYIDKLNLFIEKLGLAPQAPKKIYPMFEVSSLGVKQEYPPSSAVMAATLCAQLARMRDFQGAISEPEWRNAIGVIKHSTEGDELCHEWSRGDPRYDFDETKEKINRWETGPTTCETFERTASHLCAGCKFKGKIKSPIQLGYTAEVEAPEELEQPKSVDVETFDYSKSWPKGFRWEADSNRLVRLVKDKDGAPEWLPFCDTLFYPTTRIQLEDGTWAQRCTMQVSKGRWREFDIPTKHLASPETLCGTLASYEIVINPRQGVHAMAYCHSWLEKYKQAGVEMQLYKHYGWWADDSAFLVGDNLICNDGTEHKVLLSDGVSGKVRAELIGDGIAGTDTEWARIFNEVYDRPDAEVYQFTAMALMSAPLVKLLDADDWHGIPIGLTGASAQGKTTVGKAACSAFGRPEGFVLESSNSTITVVDPFVGTLHNLPCVLDELTGRDPALVSKKLYALSTGGGTQRADIKGNMSKVHYTWDTISLITGNSNINEAMSQLAKNQAEASQVRVFEVMMQEGTLEKVFKGVDAQTLISHELGKCNYGIVGRKGIRAMMYDISKLRAVFAKLRAKHGFNSANYDPKERFFIDLIVTAYIGAKIYKQLGYFTFDVDRVRDWAFNHIIEMRSMRSENSYGSEDRLAHFISSLNGHILVTKHMDRAAHETPMEAYPLRGDVKARMALTARRLVVSYKAFEEWCRENGIQASTLRKQLTEEGFLVSGADNRQILTKGTSLPSAQQRVLEFVYDRVSGSALPQEPTKVVALNG